MDWLEAEKKRKENLLAGEQKKLGWTKRLHESGVENRIKRMISKINAETVLGLSMDGYGCITENRFFRGARYWSTGWEVECYASKNGFRLEAEENGVKLTFFFWQGADDTRRQESMDIRVEHISEEGIKAWIGRVAKR